MDERLYAAVETEETDISSTRPQWSTTTILACTLALALTTGWTLVYLKKKYREYQERERRKANGQPEEDEEDSLIGGMAKAKDLRSLTAKIDSLEARLVEAQVIKPKPKALERWKTKSREEGRAMMKAMRGLNDRPEQEENASTRAEAMGAAAGAAAGGGSPRNQATRIHSHTTVAVAPED